MKKLLLLTALLATSLFADMEWIKFSDAKIKAKKENKIIMVMLTKEGCPACEYMEDIVFDNEKLLSEFNKKFIAVHLDIHNDYVPADLTYIGTPTFHFINANARKVDRIDGAVNVKDFMNKLTEIESSK
jgi:thioredoxin-related protein